ncbi:hypothetical protein NKG05_15555 [Oerskovia sp. M15]
MAGGTTFTFVTDGISSALSQALAGSRDGHVGIAGERRPCGSTWPRGSSTSSGCTSPPSCSGAGAAARRAGRPARRGRTGERQPPGHAPVVHRGAGLVGS